MPERADAESPIQEKVSPRHLRIGLIGPIGAGKTTLGKLLGDVWDVKPVEEDFGENPYLEDFYRFPEQFSFKSQTWFLTRKIDQLKSLASEFTEIIDPALEMDFLYAKVQYELGWMTDAEWQTYQMLYDTHVEASQIRKPDIFVVVNAPVDILKRRVMERGRDFELWMLKQKPEYFEKLRSAVSNWQWESKRPVIPVNSYELDYASNPNHRHMVLSYVEDWMIFHVQKRGLKNLVLPVARDEVR